VASRLRQLIIVASVMGCAGFADLNGRRGHAVVVLVFVSWQGEECNMHNHLFLSSAPYGKDSPEMGCLEVLFSSPTSLLLGDCLPVA
jgi:hypothetical protein